MPSKWMVQYMKENYEALKNHVSKDTDSTY